MPEVVACPKCQRKSRVPDALMGKKVKCPGCNEIFTAGANSAPVPAPPKPKKKADDGDYEVVQEKKKRSSEDEEEAVSDKPRPRRAKDDEDEEDEKPRRSRVRGRDGDEDDEDRERVSSRRRNPYSRDRDDDDDEEEDEEDRPRRRRRNKRGLRADWFRIRRGLTFVLGSVALSIVLNLILVIGIFVVAGASFAALARGGQQAPVPGQVVGGVAALGAGIIILAILSILGNVASMGLKVTGHIFCLPSPEAHGAKPLALTTLICYGTYVAFTLLNLLLTFIALGSQGMAVFANPMGAAAAPPTVTSHAASTLANVASWIGGLALLGSLYVFLFYIRALAQATGFDSLARSTVIWMITSVSAFVALCVSTFGGFCLTVGTAGVMAGQQKQGQPPNLGAALGTMGAFAFICGGAWVIYYLGMLVWWIIIVVQARNAVGTQIRD